MGLEITIVGARDFLKHDEGTIGSEMSRYELIWIASIPELQLSILRKLINLKSRIVLEKPIATNKQSWNELNEVVLLSSSSIFYSQPWTYSKIWEKSIQEISNLSLPISINIYRSGKEDREIYSGAQDWLPHDLYLLEDLLKKINTLVGSLEFTKKQKINTFSLTIANKITANVRFCANPEREMRWVVSSSGVEMLEIDFFKMSLKRLAPKTHLSGQELENFSGDHPLANMLSWYLSSDPFRSLNYIPYLQVLVAKNFEDFQLCDLI